MSHLERISNRKCKDCPRRATQALISDLSGVMGYYCDRHAERALIAFRNPTVQSLSIQVTKW